MPWCSFLGWFTLLYWCSFTQWLTLIFWFSGVPWITSAVWFSRISLVHFPGLVLIRLMAYSRLRVLSTTMVHFEMMVLFRHMVRSLTSGSLCLDDSLQLCGSLLIDGSLSPYLFKCLKFLYGIVYIWYTCRWPVIQLFC